MIAALPDWLAVPPGPRWTRSPWRRWAARRHGLYRRCLAEASAYGLFRRARRRVHQRNRSLNPFIQNHPSALNNHKSTINNQKIAHPLSAFQCFSFSSSLWLFVYALSTPLGSDLLRRTACEFRRSFETVHFRATYLPSRSLLDARERFLKTQANTGRKRDSILHSWKERLSPAEIRRVLDATAELRERHYPHSP